MKQMSKKLKIQKLRTQKEVETMIKEKKMTQIIEKIKTKVASFFSAIKKKLVEARLIRSSSSSECEKLDKEKRESVSSEKKKKAKFVSPDSLESATAQLQTEAQKNYFVQARSWADDLYTDVIISRNRYKIAFLLAMGLSILLSIAISSLMPLQHMEPLLIHHYQDGRVSVQPMKEPYAPNNPEQVQSEIVRYVINRESYDASSYDTQYSLTHLMSNSLVSKQYGNPPLK